VEGDWLDGKGRVVNEHGPRAVGIIVDTRWIGRDGGGP
jgi:hypothetical protein